LLRIGVAYSKRQLKAGSSLLLFSFHDTSHGSDIRGLEMVFVHCAVGVPLLQQILQGSAQRRLQIISSHDLVTLQNWSQIGEEGGGGGLIRYRQDHSNSGHVFWIVADPDPLVCSPIHSP
jgi:hypothetical protein